MSSYGTIQRPAQNGIQKNETKISTDIAKKICSKFQSLTWDAWAFCLRVSILLTCASLFILFPEPGTDKFGIWVYITVVFTSWFPSLAAASVIQKTMNRIIGTCIGAAFGIGCGLLSLRISDRRLKATFLGACVAILSFVVTFLSMKFRQLATSYQYSLIVGLMTLGISMFPFYNPERGNPWEKGVWRVANVLLGCCISGAGSVLLWPRSTAANLEKKINNQIDLAGEACEIVLVRASEVFSGHRTSDVMFTGTDYNEKYIDAIHQWKDAKGLIALMDYDPFRLFNRVKNDESFRRLSSVALARAFRVQTTLVLLDGIVRNDEAHQFSKHHFDLFRNIGNLIRQMLSTSNDEEDCENAAEELLFTLNDMENITVEASKLLAGSDTPSPRTSLLKSLSSIEVSRKNFADAKRKLETSARLHLSLHSGENCSLMFLQMAEHLILRSIRLYYAWRELEQLGSKCDAIL